MAYRHYDYLSRIFPEQIQNEREKEEIKLKTLNNEQTTTINKKISTKHKRGAITI
jgi:hypothetical protein